jgi:hypothetical protein
MYDFNNILNDIQVEQNATTNNIVMSNIDIRCLFYGKYKLLLDITPVPNTNYYKINNIADSNVKIKSSYIIPRDKFTNILITDFISIDFLHHIYDTFRERTLKYYKVLIDNTNKIVDNQNFISVRSNTIFEIAFLGGYDKGNTISEDAIFIKFNDNITFEDIKDVYDTNFYKELDNVLKNN